ncbi:hypothetical protein PIB30_003231, partial [Stylosanthes scabra]|nr:hypothetical protein [Stylosanthes scabra]
MASTPLHSSECAHSGGAPSIAMSLCSCSIALSYCFRFVVVRSCSTASSVPLYLHFLRSCLVSCFLLYNFAATSTPSLQLCCVCSLTSATPSDFFSLWLSLSAQFSCDVDEMYVPKVDMFFESLEKARDFYKDYAKRAGFAIKIRNTNKSKKSNEILNQLLSCNREGKRRSDLLVSEKTNAV